MRDCIEYGRMAIERCASDGVDHPLSDGLLIVISLIVLVGIVRTWRYPKE